MQTRSVTSAVRQFIQDRLAEILYAESKGALPAEPESVPKRKRGDYEDTKHVKELAARIITLVEVCWLFKIFLRKGIDESSC